MPRQILRFALHCGESPDSFYMSQVLVQEYLKQVQDLRKVSGAHRAMVFREPVKDLLKVWGRSRDLIFVPEYEIATPTKHRRYVDRALVHTVRAVPILLA